MYSLYHIDYTPFSCEISSHYHKHTIFPKIIEAMSCKVQTEYKSCKSVKPHGNTATNLFIYNIILSHVKYKATRQGRY